MKFLNFAFQIRELEKSSNVSSHEQELIELKPLLPEIVKNLIFGEFSMHVCYYGSLYAVQPGGSVFSKNNDNDYNDERIASVKYPPSGNTWWLESTDDENTVYIKNIFTNEYLYVTEFEHTFDPSHKKISLASKPTGPEFKWLLQYTERNFYIRNLGYSSKYLFLRGSSESEKYIVTAYDKSDGFRTEEVDFC